MLVISFMKINALVPASSVSISTSLRTGVYGSGVGVAIRSARDLATSHARTLHFAVHDLMWRLWEPWYRGNNLRQRGQS